MLLNAPLKASLWESRWRDVQTLSWQAEFTALESLNKGLNSFFNPLPVDWSSKPFGNRRYERSPRGFRPSPRSELHTGGNTDSEPAEEELQADTDCGDRASKEPAPGSVNVSLFVWSHLFVHGILKQLWQEQALTKSRPVGSTLHQTPLETSAILCFF